MVQKGDWLHRVFSHDVTAAMMVSQNKEMASMLVSQTKHLGIKLYFYANTFLCFSKPIWNDDDNLYLATVQNSSALKMPNTNIIKIFK